MGLSMEFDLENPLSPSNEHFPSLFDIETDHMPSKNYIHSLISSSSNLFIRGEIAASIFSISRDLDPFLPFLAVNYMDRFLSAHPIPLPDGKPCILRLVAVSCVSLALKMRKTEFSVSHLMDDGGLMFDSVTIERMEMVVLGALKWRMRSVNPFSFLNYFIPFFNSTQQQSIQFLKHRATHIIFKSQTEIKLLEFKPSIISASALLSATQQFFPTQFPFFRDAINACIYVIKEDLQRCYDVMQEAEAEAEAGAGPSRSLTPANVLDWISESQSNQMMSQAGKSGSDEIRGKRRQKIENFAINNSSQLSLQKDQ